MGSRPEVCLVIARACVIALCVALFGLARAHGAEPKAPPKGAKAAAAKRAPAQDERQARALAEAGLKGDRGAEADLIAALDGADKKARYAAIRSLGLVRSKAAAARLERLSRSADAGERELAHEALARSGEPAAAASACRAGASAACRALQWADAGQAEPALREALKRPEPAARASAAFALARVGRREGVAAAVRELLKDPAPAVRVQAAETAAALGEPDLAKDLRAALAGEQDALARQVIEWAAGRLEGSR